ncbi:MAG TPA: aminotransferase class V-fold PLP-dependent enzyme, partial [Candidatus Angelobacter sp.]|nr:aminotransferase class V-fold PLP-dependent enzyme [Candidatus Angelobacter sp.]
MSTPVMQEMSSAKLDVAWVREQFPSLKEQVAGAPAAFLDGPAGTQVPRQVMDAITNYLTHANANTYGMFATSRRTNEMILAARAAMADF